MEADPFPGLQIDSPFFLNDIQGRSRCCKCGKSRKYYCYTCYIPLGGEQFENKVPRLQLPVKIDVMKHPQEVDGKSTAVHAAVLAPEHVTVYTYPTIPQYHDNAKVLLVYPGSDSMTLQEFVTKRCPLKQEGAFTSPDSTDTELLNNSCNIESESEKRKENESNARICDSNRKYQQGDSCEESVTDGESKQCESESNADIVQACQADISNNRPVSRSDETVKRGDSDSRFVKIQSVATEGADNRTESESKQSEATEVTNNKTESESKQSESEVLKRSCSTRDSDNDIKKFKSTRPLYKPLFDRVVFIDSTWHTVNKIASDHRLQDLQKIELNSQKTKFWRHQANKPDTYLATVEAMYYFLREYHEYFIEGDYNGEYDNLLFYFVFMYDKIRGMYEGGKYLKAYNNSQSKK